MTFQVPTELVYLESHEWARIEGDTAKIGITDFAQDELGDVIFVELPDVGATFDQGEQFGTIESIKAVSDLYTPVAGTVMDVNERLETEPELVNTDPYGDAWMIEIDLTEEPNDEPVLSADEYREHTE